MDLHELVSNLKKLAHDLGKTPTLKEFVASGISKRQILKHKYSEIVKAAGLEANKHAQTTEPVEPVIRPPKILFFDIETAPILADAWQLWDVNIGLNQIRRDWFIMAFAGVFDDEPDKVHYLDQRFASDVTDDRQLVEGAHYLMSQADIIIWHNGDRFDKKKLNARFVKYDLPPLNHYQSIDTLKIAKRHFSFTSNKLAYLAQYLGCELLKSEHKQFSGHDLWVECLKGNMKAWEEMEVYCPTDTKVLRLVYHKLSKWEPSINFQSFYYAPTCVCGNTKFFKDGFKYTRQGKFQVRRCSECSKTFVEKTNQIDKDLRGNFYK